MVSKFDVGKQCLMCRGGFLSHDLLQTIPGRLILIVCHHHEIGIHILIAYNQPHFISPKIPCAGLYGACIALRLRIMFQTKHPPLSDCLSSVSSQ